MGHGQGPFISAPSPGDMGRWQDRTFFRSTWERGPWVTPGPTFMAVAKGLHSRPKWTNEGMDGSIHEGMDGWMDGKASV